MDVVSNATARDEIGLTVAGMAQIPAASHEVNLFIAVLRLAVEAQWTYQPSPTHVQAVTITSKEVQKHLPPSWLTKAALSGVPTLLRHEPATWHCTVRSDEGGWEMELSPFLRRYGRLQTAQEYLGSWCFSGGPSDPQVKLEGMSLGLTPTQSSVFTTTEFCDGRVAPDSIYGLLHRECFRLFPDEMFADLFADSGRDCVPPMIVAVVMVLQRIEGCSDREAVDRFAYDARWKYAAGGLGFDYPGFVESAGQPA